MFGSMAAAGDSNSNMALNANKSVSLLVGGSFYIITVVMAFTTHAVKGPTPGMISVTPRFFIRDISFLLLTSLYLLSVMLVLGCINLSVTLGFGIMYVLYVVLVAIQSNQATE